MNLANYSHVCRTCLSQNIIITPLFNVERIMDQQITLCDMVMECTSVVITEDDGLPDHICLNCIEELRKAFSFKKMCENSDNTLRNCANNVPPIVQVDASYEIKDIKPNVNLGDDIVIEENQMADWEDGNAILNEASDDVSSVKSSDGTREETLKKESRVKSTTENRRQKKSYSCEECKEECLGLAAYWKHMANIHGKKFKCEICEKEFKTQNLLSQHKATKHKSEQSRAKCTKNKTGITKKRNLPRTCDICNKTFRFHSNLERHKLIHTGEKPFLCNVCGKGFGQMSYLKIHSFIHTGEKPYKCQMCDKSFAAPGTLMTHVRIHTGERPHVCKICGKDFPQSGYLSAHIRTHTGEKPVECKVCHRRFNQSGRLVIHMRIHSGEKPYSCKECGRSFAVRGTLKKHIRTHTGEKPYVCSVCGQAFAQSGTLATHMKVHRAKQ